jgi:predicted DNA-binding WGR domain protein
MQQNAKVTGTHLEFVCEDHNKYYRTYVIEPDEAKKTFLIRNWGRRGAPTGQWMRDEHTGKGAETRASHILEEKTYKGYRDVHETTFQLPDATAEALLTARRKDLPEAATLILGEMFETAWCDDIAERVKDSEDGSADGSTDVYVWVPQWCASLHDRKPARMLVEHLAPEIVHIEPTRGTAVLKTTRPNGALLEAVFDTVEIVPAKTEDDRDLIIVAERLWNPQSSGPYRHLSNAVRDARRIFRRPTR